MQELGGGSSHFIAALFVSAGVSHHAKHVLKRRLAFFGDLVANLCGVLAKNLRLVVDATLGAACPVSSASTGHV
jgi:hypothetical protein